MRGAGPVGVSAKYLFTWAIPGQVVFFGLVSLEQLMMS